MAIPARKNAAATEMAAQARWPRNFFIEWIVASAGRRSRYL
jgi:hypothetical protein